MTILGNYKDNTEKATNTASNQLVLTSKQLNLV